MIIISFQSTPSKEVKTPTQAKAKTGTFTAQVVNPLDSLTLCPHDTSTSQIEKKKDQVGGRSEEGYISHIHRKIPIPSATD